MDRNETYRILIVDDEVHNIDVLHQILSPIYSVHVAKSGQAGIRMAEKHTPDLILLDVVMPDMSGFDVITRLKESDCTRKIPIIFITGLTSNEDEEKGLELGAVDYITKPFHPSIVRARITTHLKMVEYIRMIERLGMIDALTEIPNRRSFDHQFHVEWGRALRDKMHLGMLMIDVDKFKNVNDKYGHSQGDVVLKTVAQTIKHTLKRPADFPARWGGEEFAVLLPDTGIEGARGVAEQIRANIELTNIPLSSGEGISVTVSIGVNSLIPGDHDLPSLFTAVTDKALYAAKDAGRNRVCLAE